MASIASFNRKQWASQSLRVTAKELAIVSARGKNNAIAERFSKYQMAAEEGNAEKKTVTEPLPSIVCSGNLSALRKRWEQQQQQQQQLPSSSHRAQLQAAPRSAADPQGHISQSTGPKQRTASESETPSDTLKSTKFPQGQNTEPETRGHTEFSESTSSQLQSVQPQDQIDMEAKRSRDSEGQEGAAAEVLDSEKPSIPLNSLKMMFEKGENLTDKSSDEQAQTAPTENVSVGVAYRTAGLLLPDAAPCYTNCLHTYCTNVQCTIEFFSCNVPKTAPLTNINWCQQCIGWTPGH